MEFCHFQTRKALSDYSLIIVYAPEWLLTSCQLLIYQYILYLVHHHLTIHPIKNQLTHRSRIESISLIQSRPILLECYL